MTSNRRIKNTLLTGLVFIISFVAIFVLYKHVYMNSGPILFSEQFDYQFPQTLLSFITAFIVTIIFALFVLKIGIPELLIYIAIAVYLFTLFFILFAKSVGLSEVNIDPFSSDISASSFFLNVLVFIPLGFLLKCLFENTWKAILCSVIISIFVEMIQFVFALGVADISDLFANTMGMIIGILSILSINFSGRQIIKTNKKYHLKKKAQIGSSKSMAPIIALIGCIAVVVGMTSFLYFNSSIDVAELEDDSLSALETDSMVLKGLEESGNPNKSQFMKLRESLISSSLALLVKIIG